MNIEKRLLTVNKWSRPGRQINQVNGIVLHWTADPRASALNIRNFFEGRRLGESGYGSTHYVVGLKGEVIQMIPEDEMAYHVGSKAYTEFADRKFGSYPNDCTLGIEMCISDAEGSYPEATWNSSIDLCVELCRRHSLNPFEDITTHQSIVGWKVCPKWIRDHPEDLSLFLLEVKEKVA